VASFAGHSAMSRSGSTTSGQPRSRGLDAKPIVDVQISVAALEPVDTFRGALEGCGFSWRADEWAKQTGWEPGPADA